MRSIYTVKNPHRDPNVSSKKLVEYTIRAIYLGWNGWAKYCPFENTLANNIQDIIEMIDLAESQDLYLGRDPVWMVNVYINGDEAPIAIKTPLGWQLK